MKVCECCGQSLPLRPRVKASLSLSQKSILDRVHRAGSGGILSTDLFDYLYANHSDGGPLSGNKALHVRIYYLNKKLESDNLRIRAPVGGPGGHSLYRLEKINAQNNSNRTRLGRCRDAGNAVPRY